MIRFQKIQKSEIRSLVVAILLFTGINILLNLVGLWMTKWLRPTEFEMPVSIMSELVKPLFLQTFLFGLITVAGYFFIEKRTLALYTFTIIQLIAFHLIFFSHLKFGGGIHFASTIKNPGVTYLGYCGQYLIDILYLYFPINGNFNMGLFLPSNTGAFYLHWILLPALYFGLVTWIAATINKRLIRKD